MKHHSRRKPRAQHGEAVGPTPERYRMADDADGVDSFEVEEDGAKTGRRTVRFTDGDILNHLIARRVITLEQMACGERYRKDWYDAGLAASGVVDPERVVVDGGTRDPVVARQMEALQRFQGAAGSLPAVLRRPLSEMVLQELSVAAYIARNISQRDRRRARALAYEHLKLALDGLIAHYLGPRHDRTRGAMSDGARPGISRPDRA